MTMECNRRRLLLLRLMRCGLRRAARLRLHRVVVSSVRLRCIVCVVSGLCQCTRVSVYASRPSSAARWRLCGAASFIHSMQSEAGG